MENWTLLACLAVAAAGSGVFLTIVAAELRVLARVRELRKRLERARLDRAGAGQADPIDAVPAR